jgi:hypothetical protein
MLPLSFTEERASGEWLNQKGKVSLRQQVQSHTLIRLGMKRVFTAKYSMNPTNLGVAQKGQFLFSNSQYFIPWTLHSKKPSLALLIKQVTEAICFLELAANNSL